MEKYCATSNVKCIVGANRTPQSAGLTSSALPEVRKSIKSTNSQAGVSTNNVPKSKEIKHWYALRTTYGREKNAYDYLVLHGVEAYLPLLKSVKQVDGKRTTVEESHIPNIFFARGTEDELKFFVFDNVNLPFLRFYYRHSSVGRQTVSIPLIVLDSQMNSLIIICDAESDDGVATPRSNRTIQGRSAGAHYRREVQRRNPHSSPIPKPAAHRHHHRRPPHHLHRLGPQCFFTNN